MRRRVRTMVAAAVLAAVVGACTESTPDDGGVASPSPSATADQQAAVRGLRVAVVVGPVTHVPPGEAAALAAAATTLASDGSLEGVDEVRVLRAESAAFAGDLVDLAVDDGYDLVCVVGTGTSELLVAAANRRREASFCGTDAAVVDAPANVIVTGLDTAALVPLGVAAIGTAPAPVGLLASSGVVDAEAATVTFVETLPTPLPPEAPAPVVGTTEATEPDAEADGASPTPAPSPTPPAPPVDVPPVVTVATGPGQQAVLAGTSQLVDAAPTRTLLLVAAGGGEAARLLVGGQVVVVADWAVDVDGALPPNLLVAVTVDWETILRAAITDALAVRSVQVHRLGVQEQVFGVLAGQGEAATAAAARLAAALAPPEEEPDGTDAPAVEDATQDEGAEGDP